MEITVWNIIDWISSHGFPILLCLKVQSNKNDFNYTIEGLRFGKDEIEQKNLIW